LKLENILIDASNNVQLIDFGFAEYRDSFCSVSDLVLVRRGTPGYMAPELIDTQDISKVFATDYFDLKKSDIFSLGVALFTMVVGMPPFISASKYDSLY
jgi:serine/threonine protein kinase